MVSCKNSTCNQKLNVFLHIQLLIQIEVFFKNDLVKNIMGRIWVAFIHMMPISLFLLVSSQQLKKVNTVLERQEVWQVSK